MEYRFEDILEIRNGKNQKAVENPEGRYPIYGSGGVIGYADDYICESYMTNCQKKTGKRMRKHLRTNMVNCRKQ